MVDKKVLIAVPTQEYARRADFYDYYNALIKPSGSVAMFAHSRSPAENRNVIVEQAFIHNCTHILFIDDDTAFKPNALLQLLEHDVSIVSGLYLRREYPHQPLIFDIMDDDGKVLYAYLDNEQKRLRSIVAAGMGFCLIKTDVFNLLEKPYFRLGELDPEQWCDDIGFFYRVNKLGIKSYCDMECLIGHIATMILWPNKVDNEWFTGYDTGRGMINTPQIIPHFAVK